MSFMMRHITDIGVASRTPGAVADSLTGVHIATVNFLFVVNRSRIQKVF
jgi:hypothetical protein